jgi:diguanylate cyclase (GGDEF)-like protein
MQIIEFTLEENNNTYSFEARFTLAESNVILTIIRDITKRKKSEKKIYEMSMNDAMTGLNNRHFFEKQMKKWKGKGFINVGIVVCDLDGLKLVNDTFGHGEGDKYIQKAAGIIRRSFKKEDIVARIGGDEFAVLLKDTSEEEIKNIKIKMKQLIDEENLEEKLISVSISIGYSITGDKDKTIDDIFKEADEFMYHEKLHHHQSAKSKNVEILSKMLEARDFITEGHGERMKELVTMLAGYLDFSDTNVKDMALFAEFHDIGKVGIPDAILFKPGKLSEEETLAMNRHSEIGYNIAQDSTDLKYISDWILKHHERWDGDGYPFGLKGETIPIQCRILAIVDAYDAMTNDRPYRLAMSKEAAIDEIKRCSGKQFDPVISEKFIKMIQ